MLEGMIFRFPVITVGVVTSIGMMANKVYG